ncbi:hypothetical protein [Sphingorhabdus sp. SMR4y]|uniref:hypothetical protein n=1 Tax=Sphingorhabdus sp. SMR4y TaxID=2584094 RepID=UPI000B5F5CB1|nr:hypothetical protein [Sphingorhabdus sp. SMR4y]ASK87309.1 hypothetical protein SPHFLASMR4Y_00523 [Sphingorhabdus sp. SMR4y]
MRNFDMGEAWLIMIAMLKEHGVAVTLVMLATTVPFFALFYWLFSDFYLAAFENMNGDSQAMAGLMEGQSSLLGIVNIISWIASWTGCFIAWRLVLARGQDTTGGIIAYGFGAALMTTLAVITIYILFFIAMLFVGMVVALLAIGFASGGGVATAGTGPGLGPIFVLIYTGLLALMLFLLARFGTTGPLMAAKRSYNSFQALIDSWKLTKGNSLMLMLYLFIIGIAVALFMFALLVLAYFLTKISVALTLIVAVILYFSLIPLYLLVPAGIYRALADDSPAEAAASN